LFRIRSFAISVTLKGQKPIRKAIVVAPSMLEERSAGVVVYHADNGNTKYLLLRNGKDQFDLPKGNIEPGESELNAALREATEETGLVDIEVQGGFSKRITYFYVRPGGVKVHKSVVYFLGRTRDVNVKVSSEHRGFSWLTLEDALRVTSYKNVRDLLVQAEDFRKGGGARASLPLR